MSATIGIQFISPTTGTGQGQAQQQVQDNAAKAAADTVLNDATNQSAPSQPSSTVTSNRVDTTV